jgi:hypothetical protein
MTRKTPVIEESIPDIEDLVENTENIESSIPSQTETPVEKPKSSNQQSKKTTLEKELKKDEIRREKPQKSPKKMGRPKKEVLRNEKGEKLTKKGTVDRRGEQGLKNLEKSSVYKRILENKKLKEETKGKVAVYSPIVDDDTSDDDIEFVIEEDPDIKAEKTRTQIYLEKQEQIRESELKEQVKKFEEENKKLKESFNYNSHLNRISHMATSTKLKF